MSRLINQFRLKKQALEVTNLKSLSLDEKPILRKIHLHSGLLTNGMHCQTTLIKAENINQFKLKLEEYWHDKEYRFDSSGFHDY